MAFLLSAHFFLSLSISLSLLELPEIHSTCSWLLQNVVVQSFSKLNSSTKCVCGKSFRFRGVTTNTRQLCQHTHTPLPLPHLPSPLCHCLWQYRCICFMGVRIQRVVPAPLLPLLPSLPAKSFESNANTVCESMILFPFSLLPSTTPSLTWCVLWAHINAPHVLLPAADSRCAAADALSRQSGTSLFKL